MINNWKDYQTYLLWYLFFVLIGVLTLVGTSHGDSIFWWAKQRTNFLTYFFWLLNKFGEESSFIIIGVLFLFRIPYRAIGIALCGLFATLFSQFFKYVFQAPRPKIYLGELIQNLQIEHWDAVSGFNSFPSGHTTAAFTLATFLCYLVPRNWFLQMVLLFAAVSAGTARIYSLNHFLVDVVVGSLLGFILGIVAAIITEHYVPESWRRFRWFAEAEASQKV